MEFDRERFWNTQHLGQVWPYIRVLRRPQMIRESKQGLDLAVEVESQMARWLESYELKQYAVGISFPILKRVVQPKPPQGYLIKSNAIDHIHCDPWRGEPADGVNAIYYQAVGRDTPVTELYNVDIGGIERMKRGLEGLKYLSFYEALEFETYGRMLLFDAYVPHRAVRYGTRDRVSLNFTLRRLDPYAIIDARWDQPQQNWSKYWYLPDGGLETFSDRVTWEVAEIWRRHPHPYDARRLVELRMKYVDELKAKNKN